MRQADPSEAVGSPPLLDPVPRGQGEGRPGRSAAPGRTGIAPKYPLATTLLPWFTGVIVFVVDQLTKALVVAAAGNQPETVIKVFTPFLAFVYVRNTGVAFSLFRQQGVLALLIP